MTELNRESAVRAQYATAGNLRTRISLHAKYSTNRQGFGSWVVSHYPVPAGASVLELGCGTGDMWLNQEALIRRCSRLILTDFSAGMLDKARETLSSHPGIGYDLVDIQRIPYADQSFDLVIANMMLYHVADIQKGLSEVRRVLREGGAFCCATYGEHGIMEFLCGLFRNYGVKDTANRAFTLQNGETQLRAFFSEVTRCDYDDSLVVTDLNDLADYIGSLSGMSALRALPRAAILDVLRGAAVSGTLTVPKEYGMFICR